MTGRDTVIAALLDQLSERQAPTTVVARRAASGLWLGSVTVVASGTTPDHEQGKSGLREGRPGAPSVLWRAALRLRKSADRGGASEG